MAQFFLPHDALLFLHNTKNIFSSFENIEGHMGTTPLPACLKIVFTIIATISRPIVILRTLARVTVNYTFVTTATNKLLAITIIESIASGPFGFG